MSEGTVSEAPGGNAVILPPAGSRKRNDATFYLTMAIASTCLVFLGFARSYYLKPFFGAPALRPLLHVHGAAFTVWMLIFVTQAALIATNRRALHRQLDYAAVLRRGDHCFGIGCCVQRGTRGTWKPVVGSGASVPGCSGRYFHVCRFLFRRISMASPPGEPPALYAARRRRRAHLRGDWPVALD